MALTPELLDRLERSWIDQRVSWVQALEPGPSDDQLSELLEPLELDLQIPDELRLWWTWRDPGPDAWIAVDRQWLSPGSIARICAGLRSASSVPAQPDEIPTSDLSWWPRSWLPLLGTTGSSIIYAVDCQTSSPHALIRYWCPWPDAYSGSVAAASLGDVVHQLCEAYDAGLQRWDRSAERWLRWPATDGRYPLGF